MGEVFEKSQTLRNLTNGARGRDWARREASDDKQLSVEKIG